MNGHLYPHEQFEFYPGASVEKHTGISFKKKSLCTVEGAL